MPTIQRPVLSLQACYFHESDREAACALGDDLYLHLTRRPDDPFGHGPNIPVLVGVSAEHVDAAAADTVVLVPVLGSETFGVRRHREAALEHIRQWHAVLGPGHVLALPLSANWLDAGVGFPEKPLRTELEAPPDLDPDERRRRTRDQIVMAVAKKLDPAPAAVRLFISHSRADLTPVEPAATSIHRYAATDGGGAAFFEPAALRAGESLTWQADQTLERGVLIAVRGDAYSSRVWCQRELLQAKLHKIPTLVVEILTHGERRSSPYGGNSPTLLWGGKPEPVVSRALVEWLRAKYFEQEAARIVASARLPDDIQVLGRHPELLDLAQGPLQSEFAQLVLHPDPELSIIEREVLKASRPRLHLVTPTTVFRRLLARDDEDARATNNVVSPFEGWQVAMSLSVTPDADGPAGFTGEHVVDATIHVARTLISAGAAVAYGGDFRENSYTQQLAQLVHTYNQTDAGPARYLHSYLASVVGLGGAPKDLPIEFHQMTDPGDIGARAILPPSAAENPPRSLYYSDMRRVMAMFTHARVLLGGGAAPRTEKDGAGYGGMFPGVVEEAWRSLQARQPLYVLGGFGGAAGMVADLCEGRDTPRGLTEAAWEGSSFFKDTVAAVRASPWHAALGLPDSMDAMAQQIRGMVSERLQNNDAAREWNGLSVEENRELFRSRDPVALALLVAKGLLAVTRRQSTGQLKIELVHGSVDAASRLDAMAVATLDGVPLGGAGAVLDEAVGGRATAARADGRVLVGLGEGRIDADWLFMASLGRVDAADGIEERVERAARETAEVANRHGFGRLGVVTFGGGILPDTRAVAEAMLRGFQDLPKEVTTLVWFENSEDRFERLKGLFAPHPGVRLTTQRLPVVASSSPASGEAVRLQVQTEGSQLVASALLPSGSAMVAMQRTAFAPGELDRFSQGVGREGRSTPDLDTLRARGEVLAELLFGRQAGFLLEQCKDSPVIVIHDPAASKLPFETLAAPGSAVRPAAGAGLTRRLAVAGLPIEVQFTRPPTKAPLEVLLVVDPTETLPEAAREGEAVAAVLAGVGASVHVCCLRGRAQATKRAVVEALAGADALHFCGHAFFDGPARGQSGLILANGETLTGEDLDGIARLPRMAFVNACEAGRVRGEVTTEAAAFAELFLRSGVDAYLGTFWRVRDDAAKEFATTVYKALATGTTLDGAVRQARGALLAHDQPDWANYVLYGGGGFRLVAG